MKLVNFDSLLGFNNFHSFTPLERSRESAGTAEKSCFCSSIFINFHCTHILDRICGSRHQISDTHTVKYQMCYIRHGIYLETFHNRMRFCHHATIQTVIKLSIKRTSFIELLHFVVKMLSAFSFSRSSISLNHITTVVRSIQKIEVRLSL